MLSAIFISILLAFSEPVCSQPPHGARSSVSTPFRLFAYGTNIEKLPVYYADGRNLSSSVEIMRLFCRIIELIIMNRQGPSG